MDKLVNNRADQLKEIAMPDKTMEDNEDKRDSRRMISPNRKQRRAMAKKAGLFKHSGFWQMANNRPDKNKPIRKGDNDGQKN